MNRTNERKQTDEFNKNKVGGKVASFFYEYDVGALSDAVN